jgi:hypothetical protein
MKFQGILPKTLKGMAVRAEPPAAAPAATDIHPKPQEHGRPKGRQDPPPSAQKKAPTYTGRGFHMTAQSTIKTA